MYRSFRVTLQAKTAFKDIFRTAERRLHEIINSKIDDFVGVAEYNWEATTVAARHSGYLGELVDYLTTMMASTLSSLSHNSKAYVYFQAFDYLATCLKVNHSDRE